LNIFQLPAISIAAILCDVSETPDDTRPAPAAAAEPVRPGDESRRQKLSRHGHRVFLYVWSLAIVGALVILIALILDNTRKVQVGYVFGDARTSLIWVIVICGIAGWLAGIATAVLFRFRTRRNRRY
jgi:uncharacterized integral membrane protein